MKGPFAKNGSHTGLPFQCREMAIYARLTASTLPSPSAET